MKRSSSTSEPAGERSARTGAGGLLAPMFGAAAVDAATSDVAWLQAMLDVEAALARAGERAGLVPPDAAAAITDCCDAGRFDAYALGRAAVDSATPVVPLVEALRDRVGGEYAAFVHLGASSQDVIDSAAMLMVRRASAVLLAELKRVSDMLAGLVEAHRSSVMAARTLLQQAVPTTFGLKAAGWLVAVDDAVERLIEVESRLAAQLGGAAGTLGSVDRQGISLAAAFAAELQLLEPPLPWHGDRTRVAEIAAIMGITAGTMGKIALDLLLLAQSEVGEIRETPRPGRGGSSSMSHKHNLVGAVRTSACAARAPGLISTLFGSMVGEHERSAGAWQAEWLTLGELLRATGGAVAGVRETLEMLEVDAPRMRAHVVAGDRGAGDGLETAQAFIDRALDRHEERRSR